MEKLVFEDMKVYEEWIESNELFECYNKENSFVGFIKGEECDFLRADGIVGVERNLLGNLAAYIKVPLTGSQIGFFREAHCVEVEITSYLLETVAIIGQTIGNELYEKCEDTFCVAQDIIQFARRFEWKNKFYLHGDTDDYLTNLDVYCEEVLKDY